MCPPPLCSKANWWLPRRHGFPWWFPKCGFFLPHSSLPSRKWVTCSLSSSLPLPHHFFFLRNTASFLLTSSTTRLVAALHFWGLWHLPHSSPSTTTPMTISKFRIHVDYPSNTPVSFWWSCLLHYLSHKFPRVYLRSSHLQHIHFKHPTPGSPPPISPTSRFWYPNSWNFFLPHHINP